jgi:hypothetical protein
MIAPALLASKIRHLWSLTLKLLRFAGQRKVRPHTEDVPLFVKLFIPSEIRRIIPAPAWITFHPEHPSSQFVDTNDIDGLTSGPVYPP